MDQFPPGRRNRDFGLVHHPRRRAWVARAGDAWRALGADEDQWRGEFAREKTGWAGLVGRTCFHGAGDGGDIPPATSNEGKLYDLARRDCFFAAFRGGESRGGCCGEEERWREERP